MGCGAEFPIVHVAIASTIQRTTSSAYAPMHAAVWSMVAALSCLSKRQGAFTRVNSSPCGQCEAHSGHAACGFEAHRDYLVTVDNQPGLDCLFATPRVCPQPGAPGQSRQPRPASSTRRRRRQNGCETGPLAAATPQPPPPQPSRPLPLPETHHTRSTSEIKDHRTVGMNHRG